MAVLTVAAALHLVVGEGQPAAAVAGGLEVAGVACETAAPATLARLEPLASCGEAGWTAHRPGGGAARYAGVVLVTPPPRLPWLDPALLDWEAGRPALVAGVLAPGLANLYFVGHGAPAGPGPGRVALLIAAMIEVQLGLAHPVVDELVIAFAPTHRPPSPRTARRLERRLRRLDPVGARGWWAAVRDLDGPLVVSRAG